MPENFEKDKKKLGLLHYETQMFGCMYKCLETKGEASQDGQNAMLESFLVHSRNLIDFFRGTYDNPSHKKDCGDIIISDFKDQNGDDLHVVGEKEWNITREDKQKISKRLSHLSEARLNEDKNWEKEKKRFKEEIEKQIGKFIVEISDEYFPFQKDNKEITKDDFGMRQKTPCECRKNIDDGTIDLSKKGEGISNTSSIPC